MPLPITFVDYASSTWMAKIEAEIYMRIYQYAAEDFRAVTDCKLAHNLVNGWMKATNSALKSTNFMVQLHTHPVPSLGTSLLPTPITLTTIPTPALPISTTLATENQSANLMLPSATLSYTDLTLSGINLATTTFRRALEIPITYGPISLATKI